MKKSDTGAHQQQLSFGMLQLPMQQMLAKDQNTSNVKFFCRVKQAGRRAPSTITKEAKGRVLNSARSKPARS